VCAARVERLDGGVRDGAAIPLQNYTPESDPRMFPYTVGETKTPTSQEAKRF
jgi:hypothetical protein